MKSKTKRVVTSTATVVAFAMVTLFWIKPSRSADPDNHFPSGKSHLYFRHFEAPRGEAVLVVVKLVVAKAPDKTSSPGSTTKTARHFVVQLKKPDGLLFGLKEELVDAGQSKVVQFSGKVPDGPSCGKWTVVVGNQNDYDVPYSADATVTTNVLAAPKVTKLSQFGVVQGQTETRNLPVAPGDLSIMATWAPAEWPLGFKLKKGDSNETAASDTASSADPLKLHYQVTMKDIETYGTNWKLEVKGSSKGNVQNIQPFKTVVPGCY